MKNLAKRIDWKTIMVIVWSLVNVLSLLISIEDNIILSLLRTSTSFLIGFMVVDLLIYFSEFRRSENVNIPKYLSWFFTTRKIPFIAVSFLAILLPGVLNFYIDTIEEVWAKIVTILVIYSFSFGILYQPYTIYTKLIEMKWFDTNDYRDKQ